MEKIESIAKELGFDLVGVTPASPPEDLPRFDDWLEKGFEGEMEYLRRNRDRIANPQKILPEARSILCLGINHARSAGELPGGGKIARYALGRDYHNVIGRMLERLKKALVKAGIVRSSRSVVDAGPLLERSHAAQAGLGFRSKSGNLLHPQLGPWFFLSELLVDQELPPTESPFLGTCGSCRACLDACPTQAIVEPFVVDARKCISYLTIESRGAIPRELRPEIGDWIFGCDVCSEVCPFGWKAPDSSEKFDGTHEALSRFRLVDLLDLPEREFPKTFEASALKRPKYRGLLRNILVVLGNRKDGDAVGAIRKKMEDPDPLLRQHAAWALGQMGDKKFIESRRGQENDPAVREEIEQAL